MSDKPPTSLNIYPTYPKPGDAEDVIACAVVAYDVWFKGGEMDAQSKAMKELKRAIDAYMNLEPAESRG